MKTIAGLILLIGIAGFIWSAKTGISKAEQIECSQWAKEKSEIKGYWLTDWQVDQCRNYGIEI